MSGQGKACGATRQEALEKVAAAAGAAWAASRADEVRTEGRPVRGGWPGTLSEARRRLVMSVAAELGAAVVLSHGELLCLGKATYGAARRAWLLSAARDSHPNDAAWRLCDQPPRATARVQR